jgi:hypothetical protein
MPANLLIFLVPMIVTVPATIFLCRFRLERGERVSGGTMLAGALFAPVLAAIVATCVDPDVWTTRNKGPGLIFMLLTLCLITVICFLPAGLIVRHYQRGARKDAK